MGQLFNIIRQLIAEEKYVIGLHASERLEERGILEWQVVAGVVDSVLLSERPDSLPSPTFEMAAILLDCTLLKTVWSLLPQSGVAKLVKVDFVEVDET